MEKSISNNNDNSKTAYNTFNDAVSPATLSGNQTNDNDITHGVDFKLRGNMEHKKDAYKTTIKIEVKQK